MHGLNENIKKWQQAVATGNCHMEKCEWQRGERWKGNGESVRGNGEWGDSGCNGEHVRDNGETGMGETWEAQRGSGILIFMSPVAGAIPTSREHAAAGKQADIQTPARQGPYTSCVVSAVAPLNSPSRSSCATASYRTNEFASFSESASEWGVVGVCVLEVVVSA